ncbi:hypothetical protein HW132_34725 [Brasilonema sp. CT11]|nr:hypothetical protein [Brasilonema sp. CT11]
MAQDEYALEFLMSLALADAKEDEEVKKVAKSALNLIDTIARNGNIILFDSLM